MAMEVASGVAGEAAKSCFALTMAKIKKEWSYIWRYNGNMNDLREKRAKLETLKRQIEGEVEAGERRRETIAPLVDDWLSKAKAFLADDKWSAFMDENKIKENDKCCFGLLHCNLKYRYQTSRRATEMLESTKEIIKEMEDCNSRPVTLLGEPPEFGSMSTAHSKSLASRESTLNEIMKALKDKKVHRIGIYGMGGIGKTTLIEEVARRAEADGLFKVLQAEVSQNPDVSKIQQQIAERINLSLQGLKSEGERARVIYEALKKLNHREEDKRPKQQNLKERDNHKEVKEDNQISKERTRQPLVILDNMWKKLDLDKVGIPHDCKIALTARNEDVCREMEANNKKFRLQGLNDIEATDLLLEKCGYKSSADHDDGYKSVADELVKKCGGLPLAIVALANTLRDCNLSDWKHVADQLGKTVSARVGGPMEENVHPILEWSYNSISNKEKKKFFLLCCLFPLGSSIAIQDLMRYGAGLDLFQHMNSLGEAIEQAHSWATKLKSSSLLLEAEDEQHVRIHDIVREASLSIAVKGENIFHVGSLPRWLAEETFRTYTAISMTSEDNHESLSQFKFSKLKMLILKDSKPSKFPDNFFQGMMSLKVLVISGMKFQTLPSSITKLNNLRTLHLEHCELSDISAIASLVNLLFLSLHKSEIDELPKELKKLEKLKLLDLTGCSTLQKIPAGVIAGLTNLEGLYMMDSFLQWHPNNFESSSKKDELDDNKKMASLIELKSLSYLTVLEMHVPKIYLLPDNLFFPHLSRFFISIGYKPPPCDNIHSKLLFLGEIDARRPLQQCITFLLKETKHLSLEGISGLKNVVDSLDKDGFLNLKSLLVSECSHMEYIVTANELNEDGGAFPKLEMLTVKLTDNLKVICHGPLSHYSFQHLKELKLSGLRRLRNFWDDKDMHSNQPFFNEKMKFPTLEELEIWAVGGIVELWNLSDVEEEVQAFPRLVSLTLWDLPELMSIWRSKDIVIHRNFRSLKSLKVSFCPKLEILCPFSVAVGLEQVENLEVSYNDNMKEIIAKETGEMKNNDIEITILPELRNIKLQGLSNLKCFFGGSIKLVFPLLKSIDFSFLKEMVAFVSSEYPGDSGALFNEKVKFPGLEELGISYVGGIKELWNLSDVEEEVSTFPKLVHLKVNSLPEMRSIWMSNDVIIHHIFQNLKNLTVKRCPKLEILCPFSVAATLEQLETLNVKFNANMKEIIAKETGDINNDTEMTILPKLRNIKLQNLFNLKCFFGGSIKLIFPFLKSINCKDLNKMVAFVNPEDSGALFSDKVKFPGLEELRISNVGGIKELWNLSYVQEEVPTFPRLVHLEVDSLPKMRSIWMSNDAIIHHIFQNLKNLIVRRCPILEILCPLSVAAVLRQLDTLIVESNENMKEIIAKEIGGTKNNDTELTILPKLRNIELQSLSNLKCFFGGSIKLIFPSLKSINCNQLNKMVAFVSPEDSSALFNDKMKFPSLEELKIKKVNGIMELWNLSDVEEKVTTFPRLVNLTLDDLPELRSIWRSKDTAIHRSFQSLKSLEVSFCPKLEILCPFSVAAGLEQLETLNVKYNENMKEIIAKETGELRINDTGMIVFPKLQNIELRQLSNLKCFFGGSIKLVFPSLENIVFWHLEEIVTFFGSEYSRDSDALFNDKVALPAIKEIYMRDVNGPKEIWGNHLDAGSFNKLETLEGFYNDDVENSALLLSQLRKLTIGLFPQLKRIPWRELALQNLRYLKIWQVKGLTSLFPTSVGKRLVNLEELDVSDCQMMEEIVGGESGDTNTAEVNIVCPHLNILRFHNLPALRSLSSNNVIIKFPSIIKVDFQQFQNPILLDLLQKFQHVKELILGRCEALLEPFDLERRASAIPPRLGKLTLSNMSKLQMIPWKIFPIENLHYLQISSIDGLKFLFPASLCSKGFAQLEEIHIEDCEDIEHVLAPESIEDTSNNPAPIKVVLPRVKNIELIKLQSLRSFSSDSYKDLEFPSLKEVWIEQCPMVETFSYGSLSTPRLRRIKINWNIERKHLDLNVVIKNRRRMRIKKKKMSKDAETKFIEGETSQGIEEETSGKDKETQSIEGEISQMVEEETNGQDTETEITWWRCKFEVYYQYFEKWTELFGLILYPLLRALVIILMIWIFIRAFEIDADPSTKSKANSNTLFKGNDL